VLSTEGFDFLGCRFEVKASHRLTRWPSKKNRRNLKDNIKTVMRDCRFKLNKRLNKVKVIYKGWWNYHKYCDLSKINLWSINDWVYKFVKKGNSKLNKKDRAIAKIKRLNTIKDIFNAHSYSLFRYVAVKSNKSPFDNDWIY
jgi:hypothetical protein